MGVCTMASTANCIGKERCSICGDPNASRHYGVAACFGCKGFFRRSIKGNHKYICRFDSQCFIDKSKRNACRFCRLEQCLKMGMNAAAIRPDRDSTGKQFRPRRRSFPEDRKQETDANPASAIRAVKRNRFAQKTLLMQLLSLENAINLGKVRKTSVVNVYSEKKLQNMFGLSEVMENPDLLDQERTEMRYDAVRIASPDDLCSSVRRTIIAAIDWVNGIAAHISITKTEEKLALLKSCFVPLTLFNLASRTSQSTTNPDAICLPFGCCVTRKLPNNQMLGCLVSQTIDDLVFPLNKMDLDEREIVALKAIIALNPDVIGLSSTTALSVAALRDRVQLSLFQNISDQFLTNGAASRFGNILLLLPAIRLISSLIMQKGTIARSLFGSEYDPLLLELLGHNEETTEIALIPKKIMRKYLKDKESQTESTIVAAGRKCVQTTCQRQETADEKLIRLASPPPYCPTRCQSMTFIGHVNSPFYPYCCQPLPVLNSSDLSMELTNLNME